jgi:hypothetical protein
MTTSKQDHVKSVDADAKAERMAARLGREVLARGGSLEAGFVLVVDFRDPRGRAVALQGLLSQGRSSGDANRYIDDQIAHGSTGHPPMAATWLPNEALPELVREYDDSPQALVQNAEWLSQELDDDEVRMAVLRGRQVKFDCVSLGDEGAN